MVIMINMVHMITIAHYSSHTVITMCPLCRESELVCGTDSEPMDGTACEVTYIIYRHQLTHDDLL